MTEQDTVSIVCGPYEKGLNRMTPSSVQGKEIAVGGILVNRWLKEHLLRNSVPHASLKNKERPPLLVHALLVDIRCPTKERASTRRRFFKSINNVSRGGTIVLSIISVDGLQDYGGSGSSTLHLYIQKNRAREKQKNRKTESASSRFAKTHLSIL